jgi:LPS export ABC transporter protein LptC/lipopolysaccharide transport protein LptA
MGKLHYLTALLLIILLAIASGWIFESIEKNPQLTKEKLRHDPDYFLRNFTSTTMNNDGKPSYQVKAKHLEHYPDDDSMKLQHAKFLFYENNVKSWTAQASEALMLQKKEIMHLKGDVVFQQILTANKNNTPIILKAKQLTLEPKHNLAYTKEKITLQKKNSSIQAIGMRADMSKNKIEFLSRTRSHYVLAAKPKPQMLDIQAQYLLLDEKKGVSIYKGNVIFKKGTLNIKADSITLYFENEKLTKALITGSPADVQHQPDNEAKVHAQANKLEYIISKEQLLLTGRAFVNQGNRHFSGEHIKYDTRQRSITAAGKSTTMHKNNSPKGRVHVIIDSENNENDKNK